VSQVGASFLKARPFIVAPIAVLQALLLGASGAPVAQRATLGASFGAMLTFFIVEALVARRRVVSRRWLGVSLSLTALLLAVGAALSGGASSPLFVLVLAPLVVGFAAFGRRWETFATMVAVVVLTIGVTLLDGPWPPIPEPHAGWMRLVAFIATAALTWVGVASLVDAHAETAATLDVMRRTTLDEAASRMREVEQVGARVAHEVKNPLAAIKALLQLVVKPASAASAVDERTRSRLVVALGETERVETIVRDYLAFSRPLSDLRAQPTNLLHLCIEVVDILEARAQERGVSLRATGAPLVWVVDPRRIREALLNLADNAVQATSRGGVCELSVAADGGDAVVLVRDDGPGLPPEIAKAPGTPFATTRPGGTGLGLTLARAAVEQHGGTLRFESGPGRGTLVTMTLPPQPAPGDAA
jgi:signal transduction histidine kinase